MIETFTAAPSIRDTFLQRLINTITDCQPYYDIFGGAGVLTKSHFLSVNGFSNDYWGWGGEDDDMRQRLHIQRLQVTRYRPEIARYRMIKHERETLNAVNTCRFKLLYKVKRRWRLDGLNSLRYRLLEMEVSPLFTRFLVDPMEDSERQRLATERVCVAG